MALKRLLADNVFAKKTTTDLLAAKDAKVTGELGAITVVAEGETVEAAASGKQAG